MSVNAEQVRHVARLARIAMSDAEVEKMVPEFNNILGWVEQLAEVDTDGVEPLTAVIDNELRLRDDVVNDGGCRDDVLKNAEILSDLRRSDHASFWSLDIPAMFLNDTGEFRYSAYHCQDGGDDSVDKVNIEFVIKVTKVAAAAAAVSLGM